MEKKTIRSGAPFVLAGAGVLAVALGAVRREDVAGLPKGEKIARFLRN